MKSVFQNRKFWLVTFGLCLVAGGFFAGSKVMSQKETKEEVSRYMPCAQISSCIGGIKSVLVRQIIAKNPSGKVSINELAQYNLGTPEINKSIQGTLKLFQDELTSREFVFTLSNKVEGRETEAPELLAIITNVDFKTCNSVGKKNNGAKEASVEMGIPDSRKPNLLPFPKTAEEQNVVTLPPTPSGVGCVKAQGIFYYYQIIYEF